MFLSHTSELREFPRSRSFIAAAEAAAARAQFLVTDMAYFGARDQEPADVCRRMVRQADIFVGIVGFRYGSLVSDRHATSYTELEFDTATEFGMPRLVFLLDERNEVPLPVEQILDLEHGARQAAFRHRLLDSAGVTVARVATPAELEIRLFQALVELAPEHIDLTGASVAVPVGRLPGKIRGRRDLLGKLVGQRGIAVLAGMGGIGKSTVAAEVARLNMVEREVWWVAAGDASSLAAGTVSVARRLGATRQDLEALATQAGDAPDRLWALLDEAPDGWLLVLDNADDPGILAAAGTWVADGTGWLRASGRGLVVVTSRNAERSTWGRQATVHCLDPLSDREAARVLLDLAPRAGDQTEAESLGQRLGGLPLALHLAGSLLGSGITRWSSFASYRQALDRDPRTARLLRPDPDSERAHDPRAAVASTWELSLDDLVRHGLPHARAMLRLLACFAPSIPIPLELLDVTQLAALLPGPPAEVEMRLDQTLRGMSRVGLIEIVASGEPALAVHPVIADIGRAHLLAPVSDSDPDPQLVRQTAIRLVDAALAPCEGGRIEDWSRVMQLTPHLEALLIETGPHVDDDHLGVLTERARLTTLFHHWSLAIRTAMRLTEAVLALAPRLGDHHRAILHARHRQAFEMGRLDRMAESEMLNREVIAMQERVLGPDDPDTLTTRQMLGWVVARQGRLAEAEAMFREVLAARRQVLGDEHTSTLSTRHTLARAVAGQERWAEAEAMLREIAAIRRRVLGALHPSTLSSGVALAWTLAAQRHWAEAEAAFGEIVAADRSLFGGDHPYTLLALHEQARTLVHLGQRDEAVAIFRKVLQARARTLGEEHPDTQATRGALAELAQA